MSKLSVFTIGFSIGYFMSFALLHMDVKYVKEQAYKQGQIDCIEGRVIYQPDTLTNYIKIEP